MISDIILFSSIDKLKDEHPTGGKTFRVHVHLWSEFDGLIFTEHYWSACKHIDSRERLLTIASPMFDCLFDHDVDAMAFYLGLK